MKSTTKKNKLLPDSQVKRTRKSITVSPIKEYHGTIRMLQNEPFTEGRIASPLIYFAFAVCAFIVPVLRKEKRAHDEKEGTEKYTV